MHEPIVPKVVKKADKKVYSVSINKSIYRYNYHGQGQLVRADVPSEADKEWAAIMMPKS